jgi:hypothetical protein
LAILEWQASLNEKGPRNWIDVGAQKVRNSEGRSSQVKDPARQRLRP